MTPYYADDWLTVYQGDCRTVLAELPAESVHCVVTSPPYWGLRDYGTATWDGGDPECDHKPETAHQQQCATSLRAGRSNVEAPRNENVAHDCRTCGATRVDSQLGLEPTPEAYVANLVAVFREVRRVLRSDGTVWLNLGDSYAAGRGGTMMPAETLAGGVAGVGDAAAHRGRPQVPDNKNPNAPARTYQPHRNAEAIGLKHKDLVGIPWRVAFALQADGWYLRSDIIWSKPNPMPESVTDRPTKSHEYLFLLSKSPRYYYDAAAVAEPAEYAGPNGAQHSPYGQGFTRRSAAWADRKAAGAHAGSHGTGQLEGTGTQRNVHGEGLSHDLGPGLTRNLRSVWTIATQPYPGAHFATFPRKLVEPCIKAGCPTDGTVLDPFAGSGTTGMVAQALGRKAVLIDLNPDYLVQAMGRNAQTPLGLVG